MNKPKLLDLFSCAGGAGVGYQRAGFDVYSVDIDPQPNNPHPIHVGDALTVLDTLLDGGGVPFLHPDGMIEWLTAAEFVAAHGSPPCQGYTTLKAVHGNEWPLLIEPVRERFDALGLPYVIENVVGAPLRADLTLCGLMFDLKVFRHRLFELGGWSAERPVHPSHAGHRVAGWNHGVKHEGDMVAVYGNGGGKGSVADWQRAMGIDWTDDRREIAEAIPPSYTEFIGRLLLARVEA